jgi:hypothetical protein
MTRLEMVYSQVSTELAKAKVATILLSSDQMFVSKNMTTNPGPSAFKTTSRVPAADGYAIYITERSSDPEQGRPQQRVDTDVPAVKWDAATMLLRLDRPELELSAQFLDAAGLLVSFQVYCGSPRVFDEVDRVLSTLSRLVLR